MGFIRKLILKFLRFSGLYIVFFFLINKVFSLNVLTVKETFGLIKKKEKPLFALGMVN